jgi:hypothetical protein
MHCPQCGQQQVSDVIRFCSRCGFPLEGVTQVLANGGMLPFYSAETVSTEISPRRKGVKQGGLLFLLGVLAVPALGVLYGWTDINVFGFLCALAAVFFFIGGPLRVLYAALFEEGAKRSYVSNSYLPPATPAQMRVPMRNSALPPPAVNSAPGWRRRDTGELVRPASVTEHTTRLLNKDTDRQD